MQLHLTKPIVFFDLETTGVVVGHDHIVEICLHKVMPDGTTDTRVERVRPVDADGKTVHIPEVTTAIHGISMRMSRTNPPSANWPQPDGIHRRCRPRRL